MAPGYVATVEPNKHWRHNGHPYLSGKIASARIDIAALGLTPLALNESGDWDPATEYWGEEDEPIEEWAKPIIARGPRPMFEMEQVLPGSDPEDFDTDPIIEANELKEMGDISGAREILSNLLANSRNRGAAGSLTGSRMKSGARSGVWPPRALPGLVPEGLHSS